jgi:protein gp37
MAFARPAHIRVVRKVPVNEMDDELQLEEAFIDAEIFHAKECRQMASTPRRTFLLLTGTRGRRERVLEVFQPFLTRCIGE